MTSLHRGYIRRFNAGRGLVCFKDVDKQNAIDILLATRSMRVRMPHCKLK